MARVRSRSWHPADLAVVPMVLVLSILPLLWFARNWRVSVDGSMYLVEGWNLASGRGYLAIGDVPQTVRGPVFPGILALLMLPFGRDVEALAWGARLIALVNPILFYLLLKRLFRRGVALLGAGAISLFGYPARIAAAFNIDVALLLVYLLSILALLVARDRDSARWAWGSGLLLGVAILTKETAFVGLPTALVAALLLGWSARGVLWHYAGVVMVCLPWWVWVWEHSGRIYLAGRLPSSLALPALVGFACAVGLAVPLSRSGIVTRFLRNERRRSALAWLLISGWVVTFSLLLLSTVRGTPFRDWQLGDYLFGQVLRETPLWYLLPLAAGYICYMAARGHRLWAFYGALLVLQSPVSLLVLVHRYATRQWLIPQTLLYGALAGLVVALCTDALSKNGAQWFAHRRRIVVSVVLVVVITLGASLQVRALIWEDQRVPERDPNNQVNEAVQRMGHWMAANIPPGEGILSTWLYSSQLAFADGRKHGWVSLRRDCLTMNKRPQDASCVRDSVTTISWPPSPTTLWLQMGAGCDASSLSFEGVVRQMEDANASWLLIAREPGYPATLAWVGPLVRSGAFQVKYEAYLTRGPTVEQARGLTLLQRTGLAPRPQPTLMNGLTVANLINCLKPIHGDRYSEAIRATFPHGIKVFGNKPETQAALKIVREIYATKR